MNENKTSLVSATPISEEWNKKVHFLGRITLAIAIVACFAPYAYICMVTGEAPSAGELMKAMGNVAIAYVALWIIEPLAYYPALGNSGSYMGWMVGSVANTRIPASVTAKEAVGVEEDTQEAEIVATAAIAGSIVTTILVLTIGTICGTQVIAILPEAVLKTLTSYVVPVIFGSVVAMLGGKHLQFTVPFLALMLGLCLLNKLQIVTIKSWMLLIIAVFGAIGYARLLYKKGKM